VQVDVNPRPRQPPVPLSNMRYSTLPTILSLLPSSVASPTQDDSRKVYNFNGAKLNLSANVVDNEFCDPNSPLSLAGYFGGKSSWVLGHSSLFVRNTCLEKI
jgi:hypothetical protein